MASRGGREVQGKVGQAKDLDQWFQTILTYELSAMVVSGVVAENGIDELHLKKKNRWWWKKVNSKENITIESNENRRKCSGNKYDWEIRKEKRVDKT